MGGDEAGEFIGEIDVRQFERAGFDVTEAISAWGFGERSSATQRPCGGDAGVEIIPFLKQGLRIGEALEHDDAADVFSAVRHVNIDGAIPADAEGGEGGGGGSGGGNILGIDLNIATRAEGGISPTLNAEALVSDEIIITINAEIASAGGVFGIADGVFDDEEAVAINGHVRADAGAIESALGEDIFDGGSDDARADLHAGLARSTGASAGDLESLAESVREVGARGLKSDGIGVSDIIADDVEPVLELLDTADA